jgi:phenylacetate-CoA ligase
VAQKTTTYYATFESLEEVPVLTKNIIQQHPDDFMSTSYKKKLFKKATGGSTGVTLNYFGSVSTQSYLWASLIHSWKIAGYQYGDRVAFISGSALIKSDFMHSIFYKLLNVKAYDAFAMDEKSVGRFIIDVNETKASIIFGYAMVMNLIADYIHNRKDIVFPYLKGIICTSEVLTDAMRENTEKAFGVKVYNQYGCSDAGIMAFECEHQQLHLISTRTMYDVDENGRFTSTDLENDAFIFMKYDTGDIVTFSNDECSCGRKYPVISKILGRSNDVIIDMNNKILHSNIFNIMFRKDPSIHQFQILFDKESFALYLAVDNSKPTPEYNLLLTEIKRMLHFKEYKIVINAPFIKAVNAKHRYIINTTIY